MKEKKLPREKKKRKENKKEALTVNKTNQLGAPGDTLRSKTGMSGKQAWKLRGALRNGA